jgi:hypothetical protein
LPGDQPGQRREPQPVGWLVADPADLPAQHRVLVPEDQEFGILGCLTPGQHHQAAEQTAREQVDHREDHSEMIPTRQAAPARSSNRALQADLAERVRSGRPKPIIGAVRALAEAPSAFTPDRRMPGKAIIRVTEGE